MRRPTRERRAQRRVVAAVLVATAVVVLVVEPFPRGAVLLEITQSHGIETGDLPAILLLLTSAWLLA